MLRTVRNSDLASLCLRDFGFANSRLLSFRNGDRRCSGNQSWSSTGDFFGLCHDGVSHLIWHSWKKICNETTRIIMLENKDKYPEKSLAYPLSCVYQLVRYSLSLIWLFKHTSSFVVKFKRIICYGFIFVELTNVDDQIDVIWKKRTICLHMQSFRIGVYLSYWTIQFSFMAFLFTYGLMFGVGEGIAYVLTVACAISVGFIFYCLILAVYEQWTVLSVRALKSLLNTILCTLNWNSTRSRRSVFLSQAVKTGTKFR